LSAARMPPPPLAQDLSWAQGKKFMGNVDSFLRLLTTFDKDNVPGRANVSPGSQPQGEGGQPPSTCMRLDFPAEEAGPGLAPCSPRVTCKLEAARVHLKHRASTCAPTPYPPPCPSGVCGPGGA
jgi:hypothetical protein